MHCRGLVILEGTFLWSRPPPRSCLASLSLLLWASPSFSYLVQESLLPLSTFSNVCALFICSLPCFRGGFKAPCLFMNMSYLPSRLFFYCIDRFPSLVPYVSLCLTQRWLINEVMLVTSQWRKISLSLKFSLLIRVILNCGW